VVKHGTRSAYNRGCRCDECRRVNTEHSRQMDRRMTPVDPLAKAYEETEPEFFVRKQR
jgi:hypothetical protein